MVPVLWEEAPRRQWGCRVGGHRVQVLEWVEDAVGWHRAGEGVGELGGEQGPGHSPEEPPRGSMLARKRAL